MKQNSTAIIAFIFSLIVGNPVAAIEAFSKAQINGFVSQSAIHTNKNKFFGDSEDGISASFSEAGISMFGNIHDRTQASFQILSRNAGAQDNGNLRVDYALIDSELPFDNGLRIGFRAGRIKNPLGLYMETRDVAFTRPAILLPQSIYFDRTRNLGLSSDSVHIYADNVAGGSHDMNIVFGAGYPSVESDNVKHSLLGLNAKGDVKGELSYLARAMWHIDDFSSLFAISGASMNLTYQPATGEGGQNGNINANFLFLSWQYYNSTFNITSEYAIRNFKLDSLPLFIPPYYEDVTGESYYLQLEYFMKYNIKLISRYDVTYQDRTDRDGSVIESYGKPGYSQFAKDFTLGLRWDVHRKLMFGLEHHWIDGTAWLPIADNPDVNTQERYWNMMLFCISVRL